MRAEARSSESVPQAATGDRQPHDAVRAAMGELGEAVAEKHIQPICIAYQQLRAAARQVSLEEMFRLADRTLGLSTRDIVVSAYARRGCFLCTDGTIPCDQCEGTGRVLDDRECPNCDGAGFTSCGFCNGTSWADRDTTPGELRSAVARQQLRRVRKHLQRLHEKMPEARNGAIRRLDTAQRASLRTWLMCLQARLRDLAGVGAIKDEDEKIALWSRADDIDICLEML